MSMNRQSTLNMAQKRLKLPNIPYFRNHIPCPVFKSKYPKSRYMYGGTGLFDKAKKIFQKSTNSTIGKKLLAQQQQKN